jgi:hypothetical protein
VSSEQVASIDFDGAYSQALPHIRAVRKQVAALPEARLTALDQSYAPPGLVLSGLWPGVKWNGSWAEDERKLPHYSPPSNLQGGVNGRQPFSSDTNRTSAAAASRRSP